NFMDWNPPMKVIRSSTEGAATYNALLFIPGKAPMDLYSKDYEKGLKLYASGVLIMDCCKDLLGDYFGFVKGLVDSEDLSLNISREMLQHDRQVKLIAGSLEKKIKAELLKMLRNDREAYEKFFREFGANLKYGTYSDYGQHADLLKDLLLFYSSLTDGYTTLEEYVGRMKDDQKYIYYAAGDSAEQIASLPQVEMVKDRGYEILYFTESIDEFAIKMMWGGYDGKEFRSVSDDDLGFDTEEDKDSTKAKEEENKEFFDFLKEALNGKASAVKVSSRLKSAPACISTEGGISLEMEKMLSMQMNAADRMKAQKVLELNTEHPIFAKMKELYEKDPEKAKDYVNILFDQALLLEGIPPENPSDFSARILALL
ncbi:MAG TPA: molecular chaperone HtpG, partial [Clostridiales bacterium]|nr:molecular chaperone HtpG [Clostridiales bacterium]